MKTLQDMIKDLTDIIAEQEQINKYLANERLDLQDDDVRDANLKGANLKDANLCDADLTGAISYGVKITKEQLKQLTISEDIEDEE